MYIPTINPYAFKIGPIAVHWYGIFMALSIAIGAYYLYKQAMKLNYDEDFLLNLLMVVVISGVVGARLMFVLANYPEWFIKNPIQVLKIYEGGLSWHGAVLGGFLAGLYYCRKKGVRINPLEDFAVLGLAIGNILVRIGNIFNQEVLGRPTEFAFGRWPAQLVGVAMGMILLTRYFYIQKKHMPDGYQFWSFIFYYQLMRGLIEETVRDNPLIWPVYLNEKWGIGFFTLTQLVTPFILILAYWMIRRVLNDPNKQFYN
ncbi:prolipoprotein diacylglyceryl transferase Lgt [Thermoanaerobacter kivui]|uniref:Phosphatidylglycerol--prolipoprotein diacylglyceryl transferase n=1 Tax=Thermoanaerobacter kivui TaxID=2325 RepID=A0A097ASH6_THEKI|nr:prolipoprotein diacylglyceryl transferase [Thermoanaerobacter kivui]AIS52773.1 prolipoprotein diacylglyceryl transferase Lgt [Thermoanaerobacter kivui]